MAFSSSPAVSRPDVLELRDDRGMIGEDHIVPVIRRGLLRKYGRRARDIRRRLDDASRELNTLGLRRLNQQLEDGRLAAAVGAEFIDAHGLAGSGRRKRGPRITIGYQDFAENTMLAHLYAEALRTRGYRVRVRAVGGLRPAAVSALRKGRIDMWAGYSGSLREYLARGSRRGLAALLRRIGARPLRPRGGREQERLRDEARRRRAARRLEALRPQGPLAPGRVSRATRRPARPSRGRASSRRPRARAAPRGCPARRRGRGRGRGCGRRAGSSTGGGR